MLSISGDRFAGRFTAPDSEITSRGEELSNAPYAAYTTKASVYFPRVVRGIQEGSRVLGVYLDGRAAAYPIGLLRRERAFDDRVGRRLVLVTFDDDAYWASVFSRRAAGRELTFRLVAGELRDRETGSRWSLVDGVARSGPLAGTRLERLPATFSYWFAWRRFHPATAIRRS